MVTVVDRGRWTCAPDGDPARPPVTAMRARELGRTPIVVGDRVGLVGDLSGRAGHPRPHRPDRGAHHRAAPHRRRHRPRRAGGRRQRRPARDRHGRRRPGAAHGLRRPVPGRGVRGRARAAAVPHQGRPRRPRAVRRRRTASWTCPSSSPVATGRPTRSPSCSTAACRRSSGTPAWASRRWSTGSCRTRLRATGVVSAVGKGRHTTVAAIALPLPDGRGWVVDTPGVRSFGLAHVTPGRRARGVRRPRGRDRGLPPRLRPPRAARRPGMRPRRARRRGQAAPGPARRAASRLGRAGIGGC